MKNTNIIILAAICCLVAPSLAEAESLSVPVPDDWIEAGSQGSFGPDSLWVPINGAADQFISHGFEHLKCRDLKHGEVLATVSFYDMGTSLNAFGIFGVETSSGGEEADIGARTILSLPYQALMLKDRYYVKVEAFGGGLSAELAEPLLTAMADVIPGDNSAPAQLDLLPATGRVPGSEAYTGESWLGLRDLSRCLHAEYAGEGEQTYTAFVILPDDREDSAAIWSRLAEKWTASQEDGIDILVKEIPYRGTVGVVHSGENVMGVTATGNDEELRELLVHFAK